MKEVQYPKLLICTIFLTEIVKGGDIKEAMHNHSVQNHNNYKILGVQRKQKQKYAIKRAF